MLRSLVFFACAAFSVAQTVPGRYIIELKTPPAAAVSAAKKTRFNPADPDVQARRAQLAAEHQAIQARVRSLGGVVTNDYTTLVNALAVTLDAASAAQLRASAAVKSVSPVHLHHPLMDQAVQRHRIAQAWQTLAAGQSGAGAGIRIGILDCGVDNTHPGFASFSGTAPAGFPVYSGGLATAANVNNKVIVARVYSDVAGGIDNTSTDGMDYFGHGTIVAGVAAAVSTDPGYPAIVAALSGVAPGAWIGNYKVAEDTQAESDDVTFLAGLEDAFTDGMNVVNYSSGYPVFGADDENGPDAAAIAQAVANGMVYVGAAGNEGPAGDGYFGAGIGSISAPAISPAAIAVGAIENQRFFWFGATAAGTAHYAIPSEEELEAIDYVYGDTTAPLVDVGTLTSDSGGYACSALPAGSLTGSIALIQRGAPTPPSCTFQVKLNNAQAAGAVGAIIYDNTSRSFYDYNLSGVDVTGFQLGLSAAPVDAGGNALIVSWSMGTATLPSVMVSQADGQALKQAAGATADIDFDGKTPLNYPGNVLTDFSSLGPTPLGNLKPDVVAVGDWLVAPSTTAYEVTGCAAIGYASGCYSPYTFLDSPFQLDYQYNFGYGQLFDDGAGTSFASPMVAGAVAVLMAAEPGLSPVQYRSLITNAAPELDLYPNNDIAFPNYAGAGALDLLGSFQAALTASPTTVNFSSSPTPVTITNVSAVGDTFTVNVNSIDGIAAPTPDTASFTLAPGATQTVNLTLPSGLATGQYHGFVIVTGTQGETPLRLPYWYGVSGPAAAVIGLYAPSADPPACTDYIDFRILDANGMPSTSAPAPSVITTSPLAGVLAVYPVSDDLGDYSVAAYIPGTYEAQISTGRADQSGNNVFTITSGSATQNVVVPIDDSGATSCGSNSAAVGTKQRASASKKLGGKFSGHNRTAAGDSKTLIRW